MVLIMASTDGTTLAAHVTFYILSVSGTRLRNLTITCIVLSCFLSLVLEETLAVLLMTRLIWKMVEVLQQENIQVLHQRELFRKTVMRMPALRSRPELQESLLRSVEDGSMDSSSGTDMDFTTPRATLSLLQSHEKPSTSFRRRASKTDVELALLPLGSNDIFDQSTAIRHVNRDDMHKELPRPSDASFFTNESSLCRSAITNYEKKRKKDISTEGRALRGASAVPSFSSTPPPVVGAAISLGNDADEDSKACDMERSISNHTVTESSVSTVNDKMLNDGSSLDQKTSEGTRDSQGTVSHGAKELSAHRNRRVTWKRALERLGETAAVVFPPLRSFLDKPTLSELSPPVPAFCESATLEGCAVSASALTRGVALKSAMLSPNRIRARKTTTLLEDGKIFYPGQSSPPKKPDFGKKKKVTVAEEARQEVREIYFWKKDDAPQSVATRVAIQLSIEKWRSDVGVARSYENLEMDFIVVVALFSLPWSWCGETSTVGVRLVVERIPWGAVITYGSSFTLSFIVQALVRPCNPLYYALPITVAASTSLVFPTARVTLALLSDLTDIGPLSMLLYGALMKALIVTSTMISVDTLGHQAYNWSALPAWMLTHHLNASGDWFVSSRESRMMPYQEHFGAPLL
ncbi:hypothetical protein HPB51_011426 [Rhipicephalus microplus]|uniref:Uncharacterized protein n=1 Tax=Rhipicephalus microplus TaxID=6941 RepID=A0A9J6EG64_RHIMP|nr:hypothetical protein HPB51_011426 [Rhipicephalus microplus]